MAEVNKAKGVLPAEKLNVAISIRFHFRVSHIYIGFVTLKERRAYFDEIWFSRVVRIMSPNVHRMVLHKDTSTNMGTQK